LPLKQDEVRRIDRQLLKLSDEIKRYKDLKLSLYESLMSGLISEDDYKLLRDAYSRKSDDAVAASLRLRGEIERLVNGNSEKSFWEVAFKTFLHELYSKDISIKSMSGKLAKVSRGEHVMGWSPYGYDRSATVRNGWDVDEAAAATVRRMFEMAAGGQSVCRIAVRLNADGVPTPKTHRRNMGSKIGQSGRAVDETPHWRKLLYNLLIK
jgi:hypothetical protein